MSAKIERARLKEVYPSKAWAKKVDSMSNAQVVAIFRRLQKANKI